MEEHFHLLFEHILVPYQSLNENGNIIGVNEACTRLTGYSRDKITGRLFTDIIPDMHVTDYQRWYKSTKILICLHHNHDISLV
ncbi:PAS domain S-box protein [Methanospirillum sp.]|uniref:PAS domain S-box protein n=1 Tax=Methanospirillum sp. TaxID=45200 RepID=UPI0035A07271